MKIHRVLKKDIHSVLALAGIALTLVIWGVESLAPNSKRLLLTEEDSSSLIDFMPARLDFEFSGPGNQTNWATYIFSYPVLLLAAGVLGLLLFAWNLHSFRRCVALKSLVEGILRGSKKTAHPVDDGYSEELARSRLRVESLRKEWLIEPLIGGFFITLLAWLLMTIIAGKVDPPWSRPFLPPPMLVSQNLQLFGAEFLIAMLRSSWHMLQGVLYGCILGITLGFLLSHTPWLRKWTAWHVAIVSALPPFLLAEVFRQLVRGPFIPIFGVHDELAFKLAISMASWAVMWPVLTATAHALSSIDQEYRRSIKLLGARSALDRVRYLELPVIMRPVLSNLRVGFVIGLIVLLYGEGYGSPRQYPTLGLWFSDITSNFKLQTLVAFIAFTSVLVLVVEVTLRYIEKRLFPTQQTYSRASNGPELRPSVAEERRSCLERFENSRKWQWPSPPWQGIKWEKAEQEVFRMTGVRKTYGGKPAFLVPEGKTLSLSPGDFLSVIGRSGAGKSTFLRLLLGFEEPDQLAGATLQIGSADLLNETRSILEPKLESMVAYVSQRPLLLPHRTVAGNIMFGISQQLRHAKAKKYGDGDIENFYIDYIDWLLGGIKPEAWRWPTEKKGNPLACDSPLGLFVRFMGLDDKMTNYPSELSGGEAQRVHLLRWLALGRPILVMDEAFSALDQPLKGMVRDAIQRHVKALGISVINVSHDRADVLQVSDRVFFIDDHKVADDGQPRDLYYGPRTRDLALFLGHTNIFKVASADSSGRIINLCEDSYRETGFNPPLTIPLQKEIEPGLTRQDSKREDQMQSSMPVHDRLLFIPRSDINIVHLFTSDDSSSQDRILCGFKVDSIRFTGTHYEILWSKKLTENQHFRIESVIQDDDLRSRLASAGIPFEKLSDVTAELSVGRGILLG